MPQTNLFLNKIKMKNLQYISLLFLFVYVVNSQTPTFGQQFTTITNFRLGNRVFTNATIYFDYPGQRERTDQHNGTLIQVQIQDYVKHIVYQWFINDQQEISDCTYWQLDTPTLPKFAFPEGLTYHGKDFVDNVECNLYYGYVDRRFNLS